MCPTECKSVCRGQRTHILGESRNIPPDSVPEPGVVSKHRKVFPQKTQQEPVELPQTEGDTLNI